LRREIRRPEGEGPVEWSELAWLAWICDWVAMVVALRMRVPEWNPYPGLNFMKFNVSKHTF
jgi:hypothetical protein